MFLNFKPSEITCSAEDFREAEKAVRENNVDELKDVQFSSRLKIAKCILALAEEFQLDTSDSNLGEQILGKMTEVDEFSQYYGAAMKVKGILTSDEVDKKNWFFRELVKLSTDVVWRVDLNTQCYSYASPSVEKMSGYSQQEIVGLNLKDAMTSESHDLTMLTLARTITDYHEKGLKEPQIIELEMVRKDGSTMWARVNTTFIVDENGKPIELQGVAHDITEQKKARELLSQSEHLREKRREKHIQQLEDAQRQLKEKQKALVKAARAAGLGTLAAGIAHDYNNILQGIFGSVAVLQETSSDEERQILIREIRDLLLRARDETRKLMILGKGMSPKKEVVDIGVVIDDGLRIVERQFSSQGIEVEKIYLSEIPLIMADAGALKDVFTNLAMNALHAMEKHLKTERERGFYPVMKLTITCEVKDNNLIIFIRDTGGGIPKKIMSGIFDPFFTTKENTNGGGLGLGLAMVFAAVQNHGGSITVESTTMEKPDAKPGTTFTITLPIEIADDKAISDSIIPEGNEILYPNALIYLVDDEQIVLRSSKRVLSGSYKNIKCFENGRKALEEMEREEEYPALIISDVQMPVLDGLSLCREIKKIKENKRPIFVVMSGMHSNRNIEPFKDLGVYDVIEKPFEMDTIIRIVTGALKAHVEALKAHVEAQKALAELDDDK